MKDILKSVTALFGMCLFLSVISMHAATLTTIECKDPGIVDTLVASRFPVYNDKVSIVNTIPADAVDVWLPEQSVNSRTLTFTVPITAGDLTSRDAFSFDFEVRFDPNVIRPVECAPSTNAGTLSSDFVITVNPFNPGRVIVSGYGIYPMNGEGTLLYLNFEVVGRAGTTSPLLFERFMFNEGDPASTPSDGQITIGRRSPGLSLRPVDF